MQLVDRIEKRRFVGREFLLWLWLESELFDATLQTREHGPFGLWLERRLVLSEGKESTRITAPMPGAGREAKEALLRGQLPESTGVRIALRDDESSFVLRAETLGVAGLKLQTVLDKADEPQDDLVAELAGKRGKKPRAPRPEDEQHELFYERMQMTTDFETLMETLYRDFLKLRLSSAWDDVVLPLLRGWVVGKELDLASYELVRRPPLAPRSEVRELRSAPAREPSGLGEEDEAAADAPAAEEPTEELDEVSEQEFGSEPEVAVAE